jgi:predicted RNA-binding Zn-ribbon protein involved in translation (DUF1610 family)
MTTRLPKKRANKITDTAKPTARRVRSRTASKSAETEAQIDESTARAHQSHHDQTDMSQTWNNIRQLASRLAALQEQARSLGVFVDDRELLECPKCGLLEDVAMSGLLITYCPPDAAKDTGLRFKELSQGRFRCPACGSIVQEDQP